MASEKSWRTSPPKKNSAIDVRRTVVEVMIVLESTSLTLKFITETMGSLCRSRKFSLILSKTTTVSVSEYPAMVRRAVIRIRFISLPRIKNMPSTASTS